MAMAATRCAFLGSARLLRDALGVQSGESESGNDLASFLTNHQHIVVIQVEPVWRLDRASVAYVDLKLMHAEVFGGLHVLAVVMTHRG